MADTLLVTTSFPGREGDPAGSFVLDMARAFRARGHLVTVVTPAGRGAWQPGDGMRVIRTWGPLRSLGPFGGQGAPEVLQDRPWSAVLAAPFLQRALGVARSRPWDLVQGHWLLPGGVIAAASRGVLRTAVCHGGGLWLLERLPVGRALARGLVHGLHRIQFVAGHLYERFEALLDPGARRTLARKAFVMPIPPRVPDGLPPRDVARAGLGLHRGGLVALFLGRLVPIKGVDLLVRAASHRGFELLVAGDGPCRPGLEELAARHRARVSFLGWVAGQDKARALAACDVVALPTRGPRIEGAPMVLAEAVALGIPVVATRTRATTARVAPGVQGILVDRGAGPADWADAIARAAGLERVPWPGRADWQRVVAGHLPMG